VLPSVNIVYLLNDKRRDRCLVDGLLPRREIFQISAISNEHLRNLFAGAACKFWADIPTQATVFTVLARICVYSNISQKTHLIFGSLKIEMLIITRSSSSRGPGLIPGATRFC
jgi:hypothetical protein